MIFNNVICKVKRFTMISMLEVQRITKRILVREEFCFACELCEGYCAV